MIVFEELLLGWADGTDGATSIYFGWNEAVEIGDDGAPASLLSLGRRMWIASYSSSTTGACLYTNHLGQILQLSPNLITVFILIFR